MSYGKTFIKTEVELARQVATWLREDGWELRQEVAIHGWVADIVARRGPLVRLVETKLSLGLSLLAQVQCRIPYGHLVTAAIRKPKVSSSARTMAERITADLGIGTLTVNRDGYGDRHRIKYNAGRLWRRPTMVDFTRTAFDSMPAPDQYEVEAGTNRGGYWTPYRETCIEMERHVRDHPGTTLKDALAAISHHYASDASARSSLSHWLRVDRVHGIQGKKEGRTWRLYAKSGDDK